MKVITAPGEPIGIWSNKANIFLAGGITGCPDWQAELIHKLRDLETPVVAFNPRRPNFPMGEPSAAAEQIAWEHRWLTTVPLVLFWFPKETLCPITLFEFGRYGLDRYKQVFVGVHPEYQRRQDVEIQLELAKPGTPIAYSIDALVTQVVEYAAFTEPSIASMR